MSHFDLPRKLRPAIVSVLLFILCAVIQYWVLTHTRIGCYRRVKIDPLLRLVPTEK